MNSQQRPLDVLIIEDEFLIRWAISRTLTSAGHHVIEAADAAAAVQMLARPERHPDVILLDYRLPDTEGLSLLTSIRRLAPESAIVLMTADATPDAMRAVECGAASIMHKPFDMADVEPALVSAAGRG